MGYDGTGPETFGIGFGAVGENGLKEFAFFNELVLVGYAGVVWAFPVSVP